MAQSSVIRIGIHTNADTGSVLQHASFGSESKCSKKNFKQISNKILGKCYGKSREIKEQHIFFWLFQLRLNFRCRLLSDPQPSGRSGSRRSPNNADPNTQAMTLSNTGILLPVVDVQPQQELRLGLALQYGAAAAAGQRASWPTPLYRHAASSSIVHADCSAALPGLAGDGRRLALVCSSRIFSGHIEQGAGERAPHRGGRGGQLFTDLATPASSQVRVCLR